MPSSTSSSERLTAADRPGVAQPVPTREIPDRPWWPILFGALLLAVTLTGAWEWHWRGFGAVPGYRDDEAMWARQRRRIDAGAGDATVLVGSSRTLFDLQLRVWQRLSGRRPIQLAIVGTSPLSVLEDLANDPAFTGRLVIGIAPDIFFSGREYRGTFVRYAAKETPSQRVGKILSMHLVEPWFAFYDPDFALFPLLRRQAWPTRKGAPDHLQVRKILVMEADRNTHMWSKLETDANYRALARRIWAQEFNDPPPTAAKAAENRRTLDQQIARTAAAIAKLRARGIAMVFMRAPSAGEYLAYENRVYPRRTTWDVLLAKSGTPGIHFEDYPTLQGYDLPEWSHMTKASAEGYTKAFYGILERKYPLTGAAHW